MKPKTSEGFVPRALRDVWEWKAAVYQQTSHLSTRQALDYILEQGGEIARQLKLPVASFPGMGAPPVTKIAESHTCPEDMIE